MVEPRPPSRAASLLVAVLTFLPSPAAVAREGQPPPPPASIPPDPIEMQRQVRRRQEEAIEALPPLDPPAKAVRDLVRLRLADGVLVCDVLLNDRTPPPPKGQFRLAADGFGALSFAHLTRNGPGDRRPGAPPVSLPIPMTDIGSRRHWPGSLLCLDEPPDGPDGVPHTLVVATDYTTQPGRCILQRTARRPDGAFACVELVQEGVEASRPRRVRLTVVTPPEGGRPGGDRREAVFEAADFPSFVREHRAAADQHLRPILRRLGHEHLLAPDPLLAWQVLADGWGPDAAAAEAGRRVRDLLPSLAAGDYRRRDAAAAAIERLGRPAAEALLHLDRTGLTPEQNLSIDRLLAPYRPLSAADVARLRGDAGFLLDCLSSPDPALRAAALHRLKAVTGMDVAFANDAPAADREAAVAALRDWLTAAAARPSTRSAGP